MGAKVPQMKIDLNDAKLVECACGGAVFMPAQQLRYVSALMSPNGQPTILEVPIKVCGKCGKVYTLQAMIEGLKSAEQKDVAANLGIITGDN